MRSSEDIELSLLEAFNEFLPLELFKEYMMGAVFDFPCFVSCLGSCTTKADALPYE